VRFRTAANPGGSITTRPSPSAAPRHRATLEAAFCDLHGARLHGFALLVSLGDARGAEQAAGDALAIGSQHAAALSHPERAAAWLRARVYGRLRHAVLFGRRPADAERRAELARLGVDEATFDGLASLSTADRAAFVASMIERFEPMDVETILGRGSNATRRSVSHANRRYLAAVAVHQISPGAEAAGDLSRRVRDVAERTFSPRPGARGPR